MNERRTPDRTDPRARQDSPIEGRDGEDGRPFLERHGFVPRARRETRHGDQGNDESSGQDEGRMERVHEISFQPGHPTSTQSSTPAPFSLRHGPLSLLRAVRTIIHLFRNRHRVQCNWPAANVQLAPTL